MSILSAIAALMRDNPQNRMSSFPPPPQRTRPQPQLMSPQDLPSADRAGLGIDALFGVGDNQVRAEMPSGGLSRGAVNALLKSPSANAKRGGLSVSVRDASDTHGSGVNAIKYVENDSKGFIEAVVRPDGSASVLNLFVPEVSRGKGIGTRLQSQLQQDFPSLEGQVSSKAAATNAYKLGRRPAGRPSATLDEIFREIDEQTSVNMLTGQ